MVDQDLLDSADLDRAESEAAGQRDRLQPELGREVVAVHVDVRWLVRLMTVDSIPCTVQLSGSQSHHERVRTIRDGVQSHRDRVHANHDGVQSHRDRVHASHDGVQSHRGRVHANHDGVRSRRDRVQAHHDGERSRRDGVQSHQDRVQANGDGMHARDDDKLALPGPPGASLRLTCAKFHGRLKRRSGARTRLSEN